MSDGPLISGRFHVGSLIGEGGMGAVYRAQDTLLKRDVAIKMLASTGLGTAGRARLLHEAQAAAQLSHPNIVSVHDVGEEDGSLYIVMEMLEGESLHHRPPQALDEVVAVARQLCAALGHAHEHGVIHRDLKPENVMILGDGTAKLMDFGLARSAVQRLTKEGTVVGGTLHYMAPEMILGQDVDGRADLYALGVMLYELTTGQLPFEADDLAAILSQHLYAPAVPPRAKAPEIPPALNDLIMRLLAKEPGERPGTAAEVLAALAGLETAAVAAAPPPELSTLDRIVRGRMVGRELELREAWQLWTQAASGRGGLLLISGEPGIGKTRLVHELIARAHASGGRALVGASYAEGGAPYAPFQQILRRVLATGIEKSELPNEILADLLTLVPEMRRHFSQVPERPPAQPQEAQRRLQQSVLFFLATLSQEAPLLLVLEDGHWADSGTLGLLRQLARECGQRRLLIAVTYREVELEEARAFHQVLFDFSREKLGRRLKLTRLDREQTRTLLAIIFAEEITLEFLDGIYRETEGNPFFVEEVCKALVESGKLTFQDGRWDRPSIEELGVPQSIQVAVQSRVGALPEASQEFLAQAAVLGREFDFETLKLATEADEDSLIDALEDAERAQIVDEVGRERGGTFAFVHALIPSSLVAGMRTLRRRRLHRRAAAALEAVRPEAYEALAYQFIEGGETSKGVAYLTRAGDRARLLHAFQEAIDKYRQILDHLLEEGELERAARTYMKLGLTHHNAFEFPQARHAYQEGFAMWQRAGNQDVGKLPPAPHAFRTAIISPDSLDPGLSEDLYGTMIQDQLFSRLVEMTPELDVVPDVARSWELLDGGRRYLFHLQDDVTWSDGVPVTAGDFVEAWKRVLDPEEGTSNATYFDDIRNAHAYRLGQVTDPEALGFRANDSFTLEIELERPVSTFLQQMSRCEFCPVPSHAIEKHGEAWTDVDKLVSNGPFILEAWEPGKRMALTRNPAYHGRSVGNVERVELELRSEQEREGLLPAYENGLSDVIDLSMATTAERDRYQSADGFLFVPRLGTGYIAFDTRRPPLDDPRVRRALALATDREQLVNALYRGILFPASGGYTPDGIPGHAAGIALPFDPEQARRLLDETGYPDGRGLPVLTGLIPGRPEDEERWQTKWLERLGIEVRWDFQPWSVFLDELSRRKPHMWAIGFQGDIPDPAAFLQNEIWESRTGWHHEGYRQLMQQARETREEERRLALYRQAEQILAEEVPILPLGYLRLQLLIQPWVRRFPTSPARWWYWKDVVIEPH